MLKAHSLCGGLCRNQCPSHSCCPCSSLPLQRVWEGTTRLNNYPVLLKFQVLNPVIILSKKGLISFLPGFTEIMETKSQARIQIQAPQNPQSRALAGLAGTGVHWGGLHSWVRSITPKLPRAGAGPILPGLKMKIWYLIEWFFSLGNAAFPGRMNPEGNT